MSKEIIILTSNKGNINSLKVALKETDYEVRPLNLDIIEPQYDTIKEVAEYKAKEAFKYLQKPLVINDGGLVIPYLNGFPGVYTKYVSSTLSPEDYLFTFYATYPKNVPQLYQNEMLRDLNVPIHLISL